MLYGIRKNGTRVSKNGPTRRYLFGCVCVTPPVSPMVNQILKIFTIFIIGIMTSYVTSFVTDHLSIISKYNWNLMIVQKYSRTGLVLLPPVGNNADPIPFYVNQIKKYQQRKLPQQTFLIKGSYGYIKYHYKLSLHSSNKCH